MAALDSSGKKFIKYLLPVIIWAGLIFVLSSIPGSKIPPLFAYQDVLFHIFEYAVLARLVIRALKKYYPHLKYRTIYLTIVIGIIYAISDEFHQAFIPNRDTSVLDVSWDTLGSIIGSLYGRH